MKKWHVRTLCVAGHVKDAIVHAFHRTRAQKLIQRAGPQRDTLLHLRVTSCRQQGSHSHDKRLAWVPPRGQRTSCSSSFVAKVLGANYKRANNLLPLTNKFAVCTDRKQPFNLPVMCMCVWIS